MFKILKISTITPLSKECSTKIVITMRFFVMGLCSVVKKYCFPTIYFNFDWEHFLMQLVRGPLALQALYSYDTLFQQA